METGSMRTLSLFIRDISPLIAIILIPVLCCQVIIAKEISNATTTDKTTLQLSADKVPGSGGFLISADKISTNVTWEVLLAQTRRELEPELSKLLFPSTEQ